MTATKESHNEAYSFIHSSYPLAFDEYSEPRTITAYWDVSEMLIPRRPPRNGSAGQTGLSDQVTTSRLDAAVPVVNG